MQLKMKISNLEEENSRTLLLPGFVLLLVAATLPLSCSMIRFHAELIFRLLLAHQVGKAEELPRHHLEDQTNTRTNQ